MQPIFCILKPTPLCSVIWNFQVYYIAADWNLPASLLLNKIVSHLTMRTNEMYSITLTQCCAHRMTHVNKCHVQIKLTRAQRILISRLSRFMTYDRITADPVHQFKNRISITEWQKRIVKFSFYTI